MPDERDFRVRPGRIRSTRAQQARPFVAQALAAAKKAGGGVSRSVRVSSSNRSRFGRGQRASIQANRLITSRTRGAVVKARVVRHSARSAPLGTHLNYLRRDGVTRDGEKARLFGPETEDGDGRAFAERCGDDRHHFRFIVSPDDAPEMSDLRSFTRDLVGQMEKDLDTRLDWVAVDHWNTEHPHVHLIVRGMRDDGQDLVISRDYIKEGMRDRARNLITHELGPRTDLDIRRTLESQIEAERWTQLDRQLVRDAGKSGIIDLAPLAGRQPDEFHTLKVGRLRALEILGVADQVGHSQWLIKPEAETVLRELGQRGDIIKRMHRALTERGIERGSASYVLAGESLDVPVIGRLVERGLDDELKGTAYAVVDGVDGLKSLGEKAKGITVTTFWDKALDNPANKSFVEKFAAKYGKAPSIYAAMGYDTGKIIGSGIASVGAGVDDPDKLAAAIAGAKFDSIRGSDFSIGKNRFPVQDYFVTTVTAEGGTTSMQIGDTVLLKHVDAYAGECKN